MFVIKAEKRDLKGKLITLRKEGQLPAVFYGAGKTSTPISISNREFKKIWREAGESSTVKISTDKGDGDVLIHEVQVDPVTSEPIHVDFLAIDMKKKIKVAVPLEFTGISEAVKAGLGNLVKVLHEIEIEALPSDLPQSLTVDISSLETIENQIFVSDIKLLTGVLAITDGKEVVASIVAQVEEKEEVIEEADLSAIEVEKRGKDDEASGETEETGATEEGKKSRSYFDRGFFWRQRGEN